MSVSVPIKVTAYRLVPVVDVQITSRVRKAMVCFHLGNQGGIVL